MLELSLFGVGALCLVLSWHFVLRPSLLDDTRDRLFDLRESVRDFFASRDQLSHPAYVDLRNLINAHLRYTEEITFVGFLFKMHCYAKYKEEFAKEYQSFFACAGGNQEIIKFIGKVRVESSNIMLAYMIKTSLIAWAFILVGFLFLLLQSVKKNFHHLSDMFVKSNGGSMSFAKYAVIAFMAITAAIGMGTQSSTRETLEKSAMHC